MHEREEHTMKFEAKVILAAAVLLAWAHPASAGSDVDPTNRCAGAENAGWVNFAPSYGAARPYANTTARN